MAAASFSTAISKAGADEDGGKAQDSDTTGSGEADGPADEALVGADQTKPGQKTTDRRAAGKLAAAAAGTSQESKESGSAPAPAVPTASPAAGNAVAVAEEAAGAASIPAAKVETDGGGGTKPMGMGLVNVDAIAGKTGSAETAAPAQELPPADPQHTFDQVVMGLRGKLDAKNGTAEIQLNPPNLGSLNVSIQLQNGSLTAEFKSSSEVVRDLLRDNLEKLKSVLESQGIAVDKLEVPAAPEKAAPVPAPAFNGSAAERTNPDGRNSAGQGSDPRSGRQAPQQDGGFARQWREAQKPEPLDLVA